MAEYILLAVVIFVTNAYMIKGINTVTFYEENIDESKMLFWKVREWSEKHLGVFWSKPVCTCAPCMASLHSTYIFFPVAMMVFELPFLFALLLWPLYALALAGLSKTIND